MSSRIISILSDEGRDGEGRREGGRERERERGKRRTHELCVFVEGT